MRINGNAIKIGNVIEHKGGLWRAVKTEHTQPGKGGAYLQVELKDLRSGTKLNERFRSSETVERLSLVQKEHQFLFVDGDMYTFMDNETYDQITVSGESIVVFAAALAQVHWLPTGPRVREIPVETVTAPASAARRL